MLEVRSVPSFRAECLRLIVSFSSAAGSSEPDFVFFYSLNRIEASLAPSTPHRECLKTLGVFRPAPGRVARGVDGPQHKTILLCLPYHRYESKTTFGISKGAPLSLSASVGGAGGKPSPRGTLRGALPTPSPRPPLAPTPIPQIAAVRDDENPGNHQVRAVQKGKLKVPGALGARHRPAWPSTRV